MTLIKAIVRKILSGISVTSVIVIVAIILFSVMFSVFIDTRGRTGNFVLEQISSVNNPTYIGEDGQENAVALTRENAYIDAYYKYMSLGSFQKYSGDKKFMHLINTDDGSKKLKKSEIEDFAGLTDYEGKEQFFYLSSYFIQQADEDLHDSQFFYPEQIIKPVRYKISMGKVVAIPLTDEQGNFNAFSCSYDDEGNRTVLKNEGVWDYGLGSILSYKSGSINKWIDAEYTAIEVHVHLHTIDRIYVRDYDTDENGKRVPAGGHYEYFETESCVQEPQKVDISNCKSLENIKYAIKAYDQLTLSPNELNYGRTWTTVEDQPNEKILENMVNSHNINLPISDNDSLVAARVFNDDELNKKYGNGKVQPTKDPVYKNIKDMTVQDYLYPIKIPLMTHAATMSGNISYTYEKKVRESPLCNDVGYCETDNVTDIIYKTEGRCHGELKLYRTGNICEESYSCDEETDAWGFEYLDMYADHYRTYIPEGINTALNFSDRIDDETFNVIKNLGLIKEYSGGPLSAVEEPTEEEIVAFSKFVAQYENETYFNRQLIAASEYNRYKNGDVSLGEITKSKKKESQEDVMIARQVLTGTFAIPYNVTHFETKNCGYAYLVTERKDGTTLIFSSDTVISGNDNFNRVAKNAEEIKLLSEKKTDPSLEGRELYEMFELDVLKTLAYAQKSAEQSSGSVLGEIMESFKDFISSVKTVFTDSFDVFPSNSSLIGRRLEYIPSGIKTELRTAVYQAIAFSNKVTYSESYEALKDSEDISFLFVGKNARLALGTGSVNMILVHGTATTISGFISPTASYFAPVTSFSVTSPEVKVSAKSGTPVYSIYDGTVLSVTSESVTAEYKKEDKVFEITYANLSDITVTAGSKIKKKQKVGTAKEDGFGFIVSVDGEYVNPYDYFYQSVYSSGVPFADLLDAEGHIDPDKTAILKEQLVSANHCLGTNVGNGVYDEWHSSSKNDGIIWQCPWWASGRALQYLESMGSTATISSLPRGDGGTVYRIGISYGLETGQTPRANSLVSWSGGTHGHGHVAYVEAVDKDGTFLISEAWGSQTVGSSTYRYPHLRTIGSDCFYASGYKLEGFVYLDSLL